MKKLKLYIETSVWNFLFADDAPEKSNDTKRFFKEVGSGNYELFVSELVIAEIERAPEPVRNKLLGKIDEFELETLKITEDARTLAFKYLEDGLLPEDSFDDLMHAAIATVNDMDFLVSWNLKHIVKVKTIDGINEVNVGRGYKELKICTVHGVISDEQQ
jgi:predicted nucleic acid-binding protein